MDHSKKSTYHFSIDALRVLAILAVIMIHVSTKTLSMLKLQVDEATFSLFLNQISRFAVPLFFLISGFVLELNNKEGLSYLKFFKKRATRIITPFLFWTLLYFLIACNFNFSTVFTDKFFWTVILGTASYHLYFIPTLILFYLAFPFLHAGINILKKPVVLLTILLVQGALLYRDYYIKAWELQYDLRIALLSFSMFILGMVASHHKDTIYKYASKFRYALLGLLVFFLFFITFHVYDMTLKLKTSRFIYNQFGPLNYLYTGVLASFLFYILEKTKFMKNPFILLSKLSFFVFFIHVLIQNLIWNNILAQFVELYGTGILRTYWFDIALFTIISFLSFGIAFMIHKIPGANRITG
ncbi:MAG: acyltransferase [Candidatus Levybacteria bacterium]|nr:acyltransferase [Candidatus Levybacteria bacterium]